MRFKRLAGKLNLSSRQTLEAAAGSCVSRSHYAIELAHWWMALLQASDIDVSHLCVGVDKRRAIADLSRILDGLKTGNERTPVFSSDAWRLLTEAWLTASLDFHVGRIRTGHLLIASLEQPGLRDSLNELSPQFASLSAEGVRGRFATIAGTSSTERDELLEDSNPQDSKFRIFVCYRREDWGLAGRVYDFLSREFGNDCVFHDSVSIGVGTDWAKAIEEQLDTCGAVVVVMGKYWQSRAGIRRLQNADDYVRYELSRAFVRQRHVIPLLCDSGTMPAAEQLPEDVRELTKRQGLQVTDASFHQALGQLTDGLKRQASVWRPQ